MSIKPATLVYNDTTGKAQVSSGTEVIVLAEDGSGGGVPEAPSDGFTYGRKNAAWAKAVEEAPSNGTSYVRQNAAWVPASSGGGGDNPFIPTDLSGPNITLSDLTPGSYSLTNATLSLDVLSSSEAPVAPGMYVFYPRSATLVEVICPTSNVFFNDVSMLGEVFSINTTNVNRPITLNVAWNGSDTYYYSFYCDARTSVSITNYSDRAANWNNGPTPVIRRGGRLGWLGTNFTKTTGAALATGTVIELAAIRGCTMGGTGAVLTGALIDGVTLIPITLWAYQGSSGGFQAVKLRFTVPAAANGMTVVGLYINGEMDLTSYNDTENTSP